MGRRIDRQRDLLQRLKRRKKEKEGRKQETEKIFWAYKIKMRSATASL
jgi:hypothetical protein